MSEEPARALDGAAEPADTLDAVRLAQWMDEIGLPGRGAPMEHRRISGGSQNEVFEIRRDDFRCALRKPPPNPPPGRNEGILREWRIIDALEGTDTPHTPAIAVCEDSSVLGNPFYLMGYIDGFSPAGSSAWPAPFAHDTAARRGLALQLVEGAGLLSKVDWQAKGLTDLGRPNGFHDRQVDRWLAFLERVKTRELPGLDEAADWLRHHRPLDFQPGIMHGDYQFANVMFSHGEPARLAAIIDWEMGTIGDPKLDLAWALRVWPEDTSTSPHGFYVDISGMPGRTELVEHYAEVSGRQVDDFDYYLILARWKLGIVLEQGYTRYLQGVAPGLKNFGTEVVDLMRQAAELASSTTYKG